MVYNPLSKGPNSLDLQRHIRNGYYVGAGREITKGPKGDIITEAVLRGAVAVAATAITKRPHPKAGETVGKAYTIAPEPVKQALRTTVGTVIIAATEAPVGAVSPALGRMQDSARRLRKLVLE